MLRNNTASFTAVHSVEKSTAVIFSFPIRVGVRVAPRIYLRKIHHGQAVSAFSLNYFHWQCLLTYLAGIA